MNKQDIIRFKIPIVALVFGLMLAFLCLYNLLPAIKKIPETNSKITSEQATLDDNKRKLEDLQKTEASTEKEDENLLKAFYKPEESGLDAEAAIGLEFSEILDSMRQNKIKAHSIQYEYDPADDNFIKNAPNKYHACRINFQMVATYREFENFLRDLYRHPHFLEISQIEIAPYLKNKRILLINLQIKIYTQKDVSDQSATSASPNAATGASPLGTEGSSDDAGANGVPTPAAPATPPAPTQPAAAAPATPTAGSATNGAVNSARPLNPLKSGLHSAPGGK